ncbi:MAG TPA: hypothetical protein VFO09_08575 [Methyloceanibacter sp.]|jgi:hypothetical protein|nr:hypothetical protein [Methyloceanibacter sp.]
MLIRHAILAAVVALGLAAAPFPAQAQDVALCFGTADRVTDGEQVTEEEKRAGHEACQRALAETASITQKYHLQEADFDIVGRPPKPEN